jgi:hypothetical protein
LARRENTGQFAENSIAGAPSFGIKLRANPGAANEL